MRHRRAALVLLAVMVVACGDDSIGPGDPHGTLRVAIGTGGADLDLDGYDLAIDGEGRPVGLNEAVVIPDLSVGDHVAALKGLAENCSVEGDSEFPFTISDGDTTRVHFAVACQATGLRITVTTTGIDVDTSGYRVGIDSEPTQPLAGTLVVTRLTAGAHTVTLADVAGNCAVAEENPRTVVVTVGEIVDVPFGVVCGATTGALTVTTATSGIDLDSAYVLEILGYASQSVAINTAVTVTGIPAGSVQVTLANVAANCSVAGDNPRMVSVTAGGTKVDTVRTSFEVLCTALTGTVEATAVTTGADYDLNGYLIRVDQGPGHSIGVNGKATFGGIGPGSHDVSIMDLATNCEYLGDNPQVVTVDAGGAERDTVRVSFEVTCNKADMLAYTHWQWDGYYYYVNRVGAITVAYANGNAPSFVEWGSDPAWSPDGNALVFTSMACSYYECHTVGIARTSSDGTGIAQLTLSITDQDPAWSPDGSLIAFARDRRLYTIAPDGSGTAMLSNISLVDHPVWSPDGSALVFTCEVEIGNQDICRINADGTGFTRLTSDTARDLRPAWSPDGSQIAFSTTRFTGSHELALMNPDGSGVLRVAPGIGALQPTWSADGTRLVYTGFVCDIYYGCSTTGLFAVNVDGSGQERITSGDHNGAVWRP